MDAVPPTPAELPFGARVRAVFTKYDGRPHWEYDLVVLGVDDHGVWVGGAPGAHIARPGLEFTSDAYWVTLYPHDGMWVATINDDAGTFSSRVYVDVTTQATWWHRPDGVLSVTAIDLDLDVIRRFSGELLVDDEDEFEEHRVEFGYPPELVEGARAAAAWLYERLAGHDEPFEQVAEHWLAVCRDRVTSDDRGRAVVDRDPTSETPGASGASDGPQSSVDPITEPLTVVTAPASDAPAGPAPRPAPADEEEDLLAVWADERREDPLIAVVEEDDEPAVEVDYEVDVASGSPMYAEADYPASHSSRLAGHDVAADFVDADDIDTTPVDPAEITGLLLTTATGWESPLWFDGRPVEPEEVDLPGELADHLRDWADRWNRDFDPDRGWLPRAGIGDYEALGRWLGRRVKDEVGGLAVTLQLAHLGRSSLTEIPAAEHREPAVVELDLDAPGDLPIRGDVVTMNGTVGCFTSEVNARLLEWSDAGGVDDVEAEELRWLMSSELGDDYRVV
ncbi:DUF402 domain-containing protein [Mobilicoccus massiliensis]|uniref:DUF402 domain-containing protein n=1 Tax=Mobilicoccus massiliensis TaxID=1522310 RepID=UPI0006949B11|nr:DUF402 domain-containing protein [Mobilicoccus massiliensis]